MIHHKIYRRLLIVAVIIAGCRAATPSVDQRLRNYFQLAEMREMTPEGVRSALLTKVPMGTSETQIYDFLKRSGIGQDRFSAFYPANDDHRIFCHIDSDPATYQAFGSHSNKGYAIYFILDSRDQLHDILVQSWSPEDAVRPSLVPGVTSRASNPASPSSPQMPGSQMPPMNAMPPNMSGRM